MTTLKTMVDFGFHDAAIVSRVATLAPLHMHSDPQFKYEFQNFFHPFLAELIQKLNTESLAGLMNAKWQKGLETPDPIKDEKHDFFYNLYGPNRAEPSTVEVISHPKEIDVDLLRGGPYANYNWELFFHIPLTIAVHLSKTQRFAEAQRWFHFIFDPTCNDEVKDPKLRFWKFLAFRNEDIPMRIEEIVRLLSTPKEQLTPKEQDRCKGILEGYQGVLDKPFRPHIVARTRPVAYQFCVVMKYLDNLIAWGDHLFQQDTVESINEATQQYVLAANILGARPQRIPSRMTVAPKTFEDLRKELGPIHNAVVELEGKVPFNQGTPRLGKGSTGSQEGNPLFGIGRALYFCVPRNDKLLGYWDTVANRLFKIRHCMNIQGIVRPLALFDPPIDPGMLVKAAAAGIDISSIVSGLNHPIGPVRSLMLIQKALELCGEVRGLGNALLSALEKGDAEHLALVHQCHEIQIQQLTQEVKFLQLKSAQEASRSLLTSRATALERLRYYQRLLGLPADQNAPDTLTIEQSKPDDTPKLNADNFDEAYNSLVGQYDKALTLSKFPALKIVGQTSPGQQSGASGQGQMYLNANEDAELNSHLPTARNTRLAASVSDSVAATLTFIPDFDINLHFWGLGAKSRIFGGAKLHDAVKGAADVLRMISAWEADQAGMASRTAAHERRADEWLFQYNLAAHELMQIGRQILTSLIAEQIAHHEYLNIQQQIASAQEVDQFLHDKFTNEALYLWMQGEISRLYYEYYRFAFDTARQAEKTMKQELMRPEVDAQDFVKFNYWDSGRKGLLSGEALYLDVKRMEMAYHENNRRELELTKHVSLRQLNPLALLTLKATGSCQVTIPEWLYDLDCPGHYMRRIKSVALSIPSVAGPYTSVNCTLSLLKSRLRKSPLPKDGEYAWQDSEDDRFVDYVGAVQSIITSTGQNDSGMFETNLRDERFLPFEGAGAESTWKLDLPKDYRTFDYDTISDVILHIRYTARQGVEPGSVTKALKEQFEDVSQASLALLFSLHHDFPTEWAKFVAPKAVGDFTVKICTDHFPYFVQFKIAQGKKIKISGLEVYDALNPTNHRSADGPVVTSAATLELSEKVSQFDLTVKEGGVVKRKANAEVFLIVRYSLE